MSVLAQQDVERNGQVLPFPTPTPRREGGGVRVEASCDGRWLQLHVDLHARPGVTYQITTDANSVSATVTREDQKDEPGDRAAIQPA